MREVRGGVNPERLLWVEIGQSDDDVFCCDVDEAEAVIAILHDGIRKLRQSELAAKAAKP